MMFWKKRIYADAAAATPLSGKARQELERLLGLFGNPGALHKEAQEAKKELERARASIAQTIGAHPDEVVFTASGTEANNLALQGVLRPLLLKNKKLHAVTSAVEHQSVLAPLRALVREGLELTELPVNEEGLVDPKEVEAAVRDTTVFVSVQLVNSEMGAIEPIREIAKTLRKSNKKIYLHTDACQAPLWLPLFVEKLGVDLMTLDGQKVLGPKGVGCLYIKRGIPIEPVLWGGSQERGLRGGTENLPLAGAFARALRDAQEGVEERGRRIAEVRNYLWSEIKRLIPNTVLNGPEVGSASRVANNLNISIPGLSGELAVIALDSAGIAASTRSACNTGDEEPSHVIKALSRPPELAKGAIRITLLDDAARADMARIAKALEIVVKRQQNML